MRGFGCFTSQDPFVVGCLPIFTGTGVPLLLICGDLMSCLTPREALSFRAL